MTDVVGIAHLHGMGRHLRFDLTQNILYQMGTVRNGGLIKYLAELRERDGAVNPPPFLKEVMDHPKEFMPEFHEFVRGFRHDKKFFQVLQVGLDLFLLILHESLTKPSLGSRATVHGMSLHFLGPNKAKRSLLATIQ